MSQSEKHRCCACTLIRRNSFSDTFYADTRIIYSSVKSMTETHPFAEPRWPWRRPRPTAAGFLKFLDLSKRICSQSSKQQLRACSPRQRSR